MVALLILLLLDPGQHLAETLVLDDGRVADALQLVEGGVGQGQSLPAHLQPAIGKVIDVDQTSRPRGKTDIPTLLSADILALRLQTGFA
jgi:hypothetical protein